MRISDWSSDVCSSDLLIGEAVRLGGLFSGRSGGVRLGLAQGHPTSLSVRVERSRDTHRDGARLMGVSTSLDTNGQTKVTPPAGVPLRIPVLRSDEHTSELQSLMRISYAVFCLKKT